MENRLNEAPCGLMTLNQTGEIIYINATFCRWLNIPTENVLHSHFEKLLSSANRLIFHAYFYPTIQLSGEVEGFFIQIKTVSDRLPFLMNAKRYELNGEFVIDCFLMPMKKRIDYELELKNAKQRSDSAFHEKEQSLIELQMLHDEIEVKQKELIEANAQLLALSNTDKLTGIANRRLFQQELEQAIERFTEKGKIFSVLLLDIDFFKKVNDTYGHLVGDIILKELAQLLSGLVRSQDLLARYGGEEFVILLPDVGVDESIEFACAFNRAVNEQQWPEIGTLSISVGAATYKDGYNVNTIVEYADQALYKSKLDGRNRATHYNQVIASKR